MKAYPSFSHGAPISIATPLHYVRVTPSSMPLVSIHTDLATVTQKMDRAIHRINSGKILVKTVLEKIIA